MDSSLDTIFMELASDTRRLMLQKLVLKDQKLSTLAKDLNLTIQEAHRNATRLSSSGLIAKKSDNLFSITNYGKMVFGQVSSYEFLIKYSKFFKEHSVDDLPSKFVQRFGDLKNHQFVSGLGPVIEKWKNIAREANEFLKISTSQYPLDMAKEAVNVVERGIKFSYILGHDTFVPQEREELLKSSKWLKRVSEGIVARKMLKKVGVSVTISEKQACLTFPDLREQIDMATGFFSSDKSFLDWCNDLYDYQWNNAESFNEKYLKKI